MYTVVIYQNKFTRIYKFTNQKGFHPNVQDIIEYLIKFKEFNPKLDVIDFQDDFKEIKI